MGSRQVVRHMADVGTTDKIKNSPCGPKLINKISKLTDKNYDDGESPSGKAHGFGPCIRGFDPLLPSQIKNTTFMVVFLIC